MKQACKPSFDSSPRQRTRKFPQTPDIELNLSNLIYDYDNCSKLRQQKWVILPQNVNLKLSPASKTVKPFTFHKTKNFIFFTKNVLSIIHSEELIKHQTFKKKRTPLKD